MKYEINGFWAKFESTSAQEPVARKWWETAEEREYYQRKSVCRKIYINLRLCGRLRLSFPTTTEALHSPIENPLCSGNNSFKGRKCLPEQLLVVQHVYLSMLAQRQHRPTTVFSPFDERQRHPLHSFRGLCLLHIISILALLSIDISLPR